MRQIKKNHVFLVFFSAMLSCIFLLSQGAHAAAKFQIVNLYDMEQKVGDVVFSAKQFGYDWKIFYQKEKDSEKHVFMYSLSGRWGSI